MSTYKPEEWQAINALGEGVDRQLHRLGVGLTMGGEPTYVSATDRESLQWHYQALGDDKRRLGEQLLQRLQHDLAPGGALLHDGVGKFYPGEPFPRWALGCFWREDGTSLWRHPDLLFAPPDPTLTWDTATRFMTQLTEVLGLPQARAIPTHDPDTHQPVGYVLPVLPVELPRGTAWASCAWRLDAGASPLYLVPGQTPAGMRLPLGSLLPPEKIATEAPGSLLDPPVQAAAASSALPANSIQVALCLEIRQGRLRVFMPPLFFVRGYVDLLAAVEQVASTQGQPIAVEGYRPPVNQGIQGFQITPDPGVLEVNIHPAGTWPELVRLHTALDQAAEDCGLATIRFARDGRPVDTGGGAHITLGAAQPQDSPLLHRPDLLQSLVTYWQHHPSLSYLFAGQFIGPTSQCPRVDEANLDSLDQLELAFALLDPEAPLPPAVVDHLLHHLLVDATGNTHRVAFCIDKLFPGDNPPLQLGLLELRGFAMPPEGQMRLLQMLLVRACVAWFWQTPYRSPFKRWGRELHDRFLLPHFIEADLKTVIHELNQAGYGFCLDWFRPFLTFRCPVYRQVHLPGLMLELRQALEPWPVLANETTSSGTSRPVDDTTERLQVMLQASSTAATDEAGEDAPPILLCNGQPIPLHPGDQPGQWVAGVRYRARSYIWWQIEATLEKLPSHQRQRLANYLKPSEQLRFEVFDGASGRPLGGCLYQVQGSSVDQAIPTVAAAHQHLAKRVTPLANEDCQSSAAVLVTPSATALTYDLRDPR